MITAETLAWLDPLGKEIVNDPNQPIYVAHKKNQAKLELKSLTKQNSGTYKCVSRNKVKFDIGLT